MSNSDRTPENGHSNNEVTSPSRRRVLQGIGALTASSVIIGASSARQDTTMDTNDGTHRHTDGLPISIQFWTLRNLDEPVTETIQRISDAGYDGAEPYTFGDEEPHDIANAIDETGVKPASAHVGLDGLENDFEETVARWTEAGFDTFVVPSTDEELWQSRAGVRKIADRMNTIADRLAERGIQFAYHNHDQEFVELGNQTAYECWVRQTNDNVGLQLDAGWVLAAGYDPVAVATRYADRVESLHVKDMTVESGGEAEFASIGTGNLNLEALIAVALYTLDEPDLVFENDDPGETDDEILAEMHRGVNVISNIQNRLLGRQITFNH